MNGFERASAPLKTVYGDSTLYCYSFGAREEDNVLCLEVPWRGDPLVRVQSACYTGEILRSTDCDCHEQLDTSLRLIHEGGGLLAYMLCDGRGAGLMVKLRALDLLATDGVDTHDAYSLLGVPLDPRRYGRVSAVLLDRGATTVRLLTNNPRKLAGLAVNGITVMRMPLEVAPTSDSLPYLEVKRAKMGHLLAGLGIVQPPSGRL
jgi:GTP cyclohydrolase II